MGVLDPQLLHQTPAVRRVCGHAERSLNTVAVGEPGPVVAQKGVPIGKRRLAHQRFRPLRAETPVNQHDGLPGALQLVLELETVK